MRFSLELGLHSAVGLYLCLDEGDGRCEDVRSSLRAYLYGLLSIEEMENLDSYYRSLSLEAARPREAGREP